MFNEDGEKVCSRYTVSYEGYLFVGDNEEGFNYHDYDRWEDVQGLMISYPDIIRVHDNEYGVDWKEGEWY